MKLNVREHAKDCPGCGAEGPVLTNTVDAETRQPKGHKVACFECGALGPLAADMHHAVAAWNEMEIPSERLVASPQ